MLFSNFCKQPLFQILCVTLWAVCICKLHNFILLLQKNTKSLCMLLDPEQFLSPTEAGYSTISVKTPYIAMTASLHHYLHSEKYVCNFSIRLGGRFIFSTIITSKNYKKFRAQRLDKRPAVSFSRPMVNIAINQHGKLQLGIRSWKTAERTVYSCR